MRILVAADLHFPIQHVDAIEQLLQRIRNTQPDVVCLNGDIIDCNAISHFLGDPECPTLQEELDSAKEFFVRLVKVVGRGRWDLLLGNHEDRLKKLLWEKPGLHKLRALDWHSMLAIPKQRVHDFGEIVKYGEIAVYHGDRGLANTAHRARVRLEAAGTSVVVTSHAHRASINYSHDRSGLGASVVTPCLMDPAKQNYCKPAPSWDIGWTEITTQPGRFPRIEHVIFD